MTPVLLDLKGEVRSSRLPGDALREAILAEPDEVTVEEYAAKVPVWLTLLRLKDGNHGRHS